MVGETINGVKLKSHVIHKEGGVEVLSVEVVAWRKNNVVDKP